MKPNIGELWEIGELWDTVKVDVGNKRTTFLISGYGLVVGIHRNHDDFGDYYKTLFCGKIIELFRNNFGERIQ